MKRLSAFFASAVTSGLLLITVLCGCDKPEPLKIGFSGCLTGRLSDLGTAGRNGAMLAVEQTNKAGGIRGRPITLIVKDDKHDPDMAIAADKELMDQGVIAIIGHMTSAMTLAALPQINREKVVMVGPVVSSEEFSGIDDYFFRVIGSNHTRSRLTADYIATKTDVKILTGLFDMGNRSYVSSWLVSFKERFEAHPGCRVIPLLFNSTGNIVYGDLVDKILESESQGLLLVASPLHSAMVCQQLRKKGSKIPVFGSDWNPTKDLLLRGGKAVEGMVFFHFFDPNSQTTDYLRFKNDYIDAFGTEPSFGAMGAYDAATLLINALRIDDTPENLKKTILAHRVVKGLQDDFELDANGDAGRRNHRLMVKDGKFVTVE